MRKLLLLALLLYDIVALATRMNYDYDDVDGNKRHSLIDDRRNWRKKVLLGPTDLDHKEYADRKRHDYESQRFYDDQDPKLFGGIERQRELELASYKKRYEDLEKLTSIKSGEMAHSSPSYLDDKKSTSGMNCERQHERFESCFAGCAAVTCDNPRERLRPCYPFCEPGCVCVPPFVRDDRTHKCVLPDDCTKGLKGIPDLGEEI